MIIWTASSEFGTYRLCEQRRFRRACASAQSRQNLRCSLIQAVSQEEPSYRKPDPWPLWMAGHAQLKFVMTECFSWLTACMSEQRRFRRACAFAQSRQNLRCSLIQAVSQEEPSYRKPDPWRLWMAGHAQLKFVMTECSKTQIRLTGLILLLMLNYRSLKWQPDRNPADNRWGKNFREVCDYFCGN